MSTTQAGCGTLQPPTTKSSDYLVVYNTIVGLQRDSQNAYQNANTANAELTDTVGALQDFAACRDVNGNDLCQPVTFGAVRQALLARLWAESNPELNPDVLQSQAQQAQALLAKLPSDDPWLKDATAALECTRERIYRAQQIVGVTKATLQPLLNALTNLQPPDIHEPTTDEMQRKVTAYFLPDQYSLPLYEKTKIVAAVSCTNQLTNRVLPQVSLEVDYQNQGPLSASGGIIVSMLGQHQVGIRNKNIANGSNAFTTYFAVTNHSPQQFIPFSLLNLYLTGTSKANLNFSGGIGINPYNGSTQVEYFLGPNLTIKKVALLAGLHIGRYQNLGGGFHIGQPVPSGWTSSTPVPTDLNYTAHLGVGIAYTIP